MLGVEPLDVAIHMGLEAIGGLVLLYAYSFCSHWRHRAAIWFVGALFFSYVTVLLVG